jgi:CBS domain-containing protein
MSEHQKIQEFMAREATTVDGGTPLVEVARLLAEGDLTAVLVLSGDRLEGILTDRDLVRAVADGVDATVTTAEEVASLDIAAVGPDDTVASAIDLMRAMGIRRIPVVDNGRPCGVVTLGDLALALDFDWDSRLTSGGL